MPRRKKKQSGGAVGAPLWMTTYGDMMTLLLTFFVLMLSFSTIKIDDFKAAIGSLKKALGVLHGQRSIMYTPKNTVYLPHRPEILNIARDIREYLQEKDMDGLVQMELTGEGIKFKMNSALLYDLGKADLKQGSFPVLDNIAYLVNKFGSSAVIGGHTDDLPISNLEFESNWDLSASRSIGVLNHFLSLPKTEPGKYHIAAYAEYKPLVPNTSERNRVKNRRVEIMVKLKDPPSQFSDKEIELLLEYVDPVLGDGPEPELDDTTGRRVDGGKD